jgi:hypothetical protein
MKSLAIALSRGWRERIGGQIMGAVELMYNVSLI